MPQSRDIKHKNEFFFFLGLLALHTSTYLVLLLPSLQQKKNALGFVDPVRVDVFKWLTQVSPTCRSLAHPFPPLPPPSASVHGANQFNHGPFFYSFFFNTKERKNWNTLIIDHFIYPFTFLLVLSLIFNFQVFFSILFEVIPPRTSGQLSTKKKQPFRGNLYTNFFFFWPDMLVVRSE
jgi:hypothetical protein